MVQPLFQLNVSGSLADWLTAGGGLLVFVATAVLAYYASEQMAALRKQASDDDDRARQQIAAAKETADREIEAARQRLEAQRMADDERAQQQIAAAREAADRQVHEMRAQLDATYRPLLIEVEPTGPVFPDMGARPNPDIRPRSEGVVPDTINIRFGKVGTEIDPRALYVKFTGALANVSVPLRNVGRGLASIHSAGIRLEANDVAAPEWWDVRRERVPVGESTRVLLVVRYPPGLELPYEDPRSETSPWILQVPYTDFVGGQPCFASVHLSRDTNESPDDGWRVVSVDQIVLEEFFAGRTDTGRSVRVYAKSTAHETLIDVEGTPFEIAGPVMLFGTLDGRPITIKTVSMHPDSAVLIVTPTGVVAATADGVDPVEGRSALSDLAHKAPIGGWQIECISEAVDDAGWEIFGLRISNQIVAAEIEVKLSAQVATGWRSRYDRPLRDLVVGNEARRIRRWSLKKIQESGSHPILGGLPLA